MNKELEIINKIKAEESLVDKLKSLKINAPTLGSERQALLDMEFKKAYIKGLKDALAIIQKK